MNNRGLELDRSLFSKLEALMRQTDLPKDHPHVVACRTQLFQLGANNHLFRQRVDSRTREMLRRGVKSALKLREPPVDDVAFEFIDHVRRAFTEVGTAVGELRDGCAAFLRYVGSTDPLTLRVNN